MRVLRLLLLLGIIKLVPRGTHCMVHDPDEKLANHRPRHFLALSNMSYLKFGLNKDRATVGYPVIFE